MSTDDMLKTVRHGTAFFDGELNGLSDAELDGPSLLPGWSRRHVAAHVGYNALAIARLVSWAETGVETPMYASCEARNEEIDSGAAFEPDGLRKLCLHSGMLLDSAWTNLPGENWAGVVQTAQGRVVPVSETIWIRTREVWVHAVDLNTTADFSDVPGAVLERILGDVVESWSVRGEISGLRLESPAGGVYGDQAAAYPHVVTGDLAALTRWACGRSGSAVTSNRHDSPTAPSWL
ncbi:hypothetical protein GY21_01965 [Cryobacterium roopkundense]|uniref:Maleylpyruvate isomerase n=1 Tax=Cryobacterium roopkundense TaxID=1001240 RepID=A0A099JUT3_9MICO|nr:maleylpyruvate isomerase family mycothiol-dependent enzyme [Cryobacterium roopkundense]KGJ81143.1 hypothetical protein GY21_01965 [Cryobacterium roopkundense]MBB5641852.1 maleylpyruvate isomerase [Cryobacterium roopkundense]